MHHNVLLPLILNVEDEPKTLVTSPHVHASSSHPSVVMRQMSDSLSANGLHSQKRFKFDQLAYISCEELSAASDAPSSQNTREESLFVILLQTQMIPWVKDLIMMSANCNKEVRDKIRGNGQLSIVCFSSMLPGCVIYLIGWMAVFFTQLLIRYRKTFYTYNTSCNYIYVTSFNLLCVSTLMYVFSQKVSR